MVCHSTNKFGGHRHCGSGYMFLIDGVLKKFVSLTMIAMVIQKAETVSVIIAIGAKREKYFINNTDLYIRTTTDKIELTGKVQGDKKCCNHKRYIFSKRIQKLKNLLTFHDYLSELCS